VMIGEFAAWRLGTCERNCIQKWNSNSRWARRIKGLNAFLELQAYLLEKGHGWYLSRSASR
jgi:hypothetical protein